MSLLVGTPEWGIAGSVFGIDEAGRGCLAGPVVAACVAFDWQKPNLIHDLDANFIIRDSKLMSRAQRQESSSAIKECAFAYGVGVVESDVIDEINILQATFEAMRRAVAQINADQKSATNLFLIDGNQCVPKVTWNQKTIVDGDAKVFSIAAASIIAKEHRDALMEELHEQYPQYGFAQHKGYGTKMHREAILQYGPTPIHRKTFLKNLQKC